MRSFTAAGNYVGQKVLFITGTVIAGYLIGLKLQHTFSKDIYREINEQERLRMLKEIKESGIVERIIEKERANKAIDNTVNVQNRNRKVV